MAVSASKINLGGVARKLVIDGLLDEAAAQDHYQKALKEKKQFVPYLVENKLVASKDIGLAASQEFGVPLMDLDAMELDMDTVKMVKEDLIKKHHTLPIFKRGKRLYIAASDPTYIQAVDEIKFAVGVQVEQILVEEDKLAKTITKVLEELEGGLGMEENDELENLDDLEVADDQAEAKKGDDS